MERNATQEARQRHERHERQRGCGDAQHVQPGRKPIAPCSGEREDAQRRSEKQRYGVDDVAEQVSRSLRLDRQAMRTSPDARKKEARGLDAALSPTFLLDLYGAHLRWELARNRHVIQKNEAPPGQLRPIAQVEVFGQCCRPPASRLLHTLAPPHPGRPVRVEEQSRTEASLLLDVEVSVQKESLGARQPVVALVQVAPRRLHHAHAGIGERRQEPSQKIGLRDEVRVQNEEEVAPGPPESLGESSGLVADSRAPADVFDASSAATPGGHSCRCDGGRFVRRVVEQLDLEAIARIVEGARPVDQPTDNVRLVVDGQLYGDAGQLADPALRQLHRRSPQPAPEEQHPVRAEGQEKKQNQRVRERSGAYRLAQRFVHRGVLRRFFRSFDGEHPLARRTARSRSLAFRAPHLRICMAANIWSILVGTRLRGRLPGLDSPCNVEIVTCAERPS